MKIATTALQQTELILLRLNFIHSFLERTYEKNDYLSIPLGEDHQKQMLESCSRDIYYFFTHIFHSTSEAHKLLGLFVKCRANLCAFYIQLSEENQAKLLNFDLFELSQKVR